MENTNSEGISISLDDLTHPSNDWIATHLERKGNPVWTRTIDIDGHVIVLTNYDAEFNFTEMHQRELVDFVRRARELNLDIIAHFKSLIFDDYQPQSSYLDEESFPINGTRLDDGVLLYKRGQQIDIRHRTGVASNFQGTVAHECFHFVDKSGYEKTWKDAFDWHYCTENISDWEKVSGPNDRSFRNRQTGWVAYEGQYTDHPDWCITEYAKLAWDDDFADTGVVTLFEPQKMQSVCEPKLEFIRGLKASPSS